MDFVGGLLQDHGCSAEGTATTNPVMNLLGIMQDLCSIDCSSNSTTQGIEVNHDTITSLSPVQHDHPMRVEALRVHDFGITSDIYKVEINLACLLDSL